MVAQQGRRKRHSNSRKGCGNCKLRHVKCDETRPGCLKCRNNGLLCSYASNVAELSSSHEQEVPQTTSICSTNQVIMDHLNNIIASASDKGASVGKIFQLDLPDLERLSRFQNRTLTSSGLTIAGRVFQKEALRLMTTNQHLLHIAMTVTAMHDRYLAHEAHRERTPLESYHWSMALQYLNQDLSFNIQSSNLDAIWMTAAFICWASLFAIETDDPEQVWPLRPATPADLTWLEMQKGLRTLWPMVDFERSGSVFQGATEPFSERCLGIQLPSEGIGGVLPPLVALCALEQTSNDSNNPYHTAAHMLSILIQDDVSCTKTLRFLAFPNTMQSAFEALLRLKDPCALVMMALWYELIEQSTWWMSGRASLEHRAIWIYLNRYHADDSRIKAFIASSTSTWGAPTATDIKHLGSDYRALWWRYQI